MSVTIVGAGIGGLTLALQLHARGISCHIYEVVSRLEPLGVGINLLPHGMKELDALGLADEVRSTGVETANYRFYSRYGQLIHREARGIAAGYQWPQVSIHRGILHQILLRTVTERLGPDAVRTGARFVYCDQTEFGVHVSFEYEGGAIDSFLTEVLVGCDGMRSTVRKQVFPDPDPLVYSGITMWRGITRWPPIFDGKTMVYAGWLETGKLIAYPLSDELDSQGRQMVNWLVEFFVPPREPSADWSQEGKLEDFSWACSDMHFEFLDVPKFVAAAEQILEYPMVDRDPIPYWTDGRVTLLGDAAHPMTPRGSNGAGQAILDARVLAEQLAEHADPFVALHHYDSVRVPATSRVVEANRTEPPDAILREVFERTNDAPFANIDEVISKGEIAEISSRYKRAAGFAPEQLNTKT
jgi:5-methylphenazine-1-carboxylate 1-monooxygenase